LRGNLKGEGLVARVARDVEVVEAAQADHVRPPPVALLHLLRVSGSGLRA